MLIETESLRLSPTTCLFEGAHHGGGVQLSIYLVEYAPGTGARLHVHPHPEVFVIESGEAMFTVGEEEIQVRAGQIVIAPANKPHRFTSTGAIPLHAVNILPSDQSLVTWLEDELGGAAR
jgi:mannose-6-phosphate isomerase-like protein (cupin superfamily)